MHKYFEIKASSGNIRCKIYFSENNAAEKAVIFCTGFAGHKDNNAANGFANKLLSKYKDMIVVVFNWPAHGDDVKKKLTLADCDAYLDAVINEVKAKYAVRELYSYATSFGGYLVLKYISEHGNPFEKLAFRCPAVDMYDVLTHTIMKGGEYDSIMKGKNVEAGFDRKILVTPALLDDLKANDIRQREYLEYADQILILHGTKDEVVPFNEGREFAENNMIEFSPVPGADHRFQNPSHMSLANKYVMEFFLGSKEKKMLDFMKKHEGCMLENRPGGCSSYYDRSLHKWRMRIQLDEERIWFLSIFVHEDGTLDKYSLDRELAEDSHYEFSDEEGIRQKLYQPGDEKRTFADILIRYVARTSGGDLLWAIYPFITAQFHYD